MFIPEQLKRKQKAKRIGASPLIQHRLAQENTHCNCCELCVKVTENLLKLAATSDLNKVKHGCCACVYNDIITYTSTD